MSVKELILKPEIGDEVKVTLNGKEFEFDLGEHERSYLWLDRSQAHLLMLYLQEHLKAPSTISKGLDEAIIDELNNPPKEIMG